MITPTLRKYCGIIPGKDKGKTHLLFNITRCEECDKEVVEHDPLKVTDKYHAELIQEGYEIRSIPAEEAIVWEIEDDGDSHTYCQTCLNEKKRSYKERRTLRFVKIAFEDINNMNYGDALVALAEILKLNIHNPEEERHSVRKVAGNFAYEVVFGGSKEECKDYAREHRTVLWTYVVVDKNNEEV